MGPIEQTNPKEMNRKGRRAFAHRHKAEMVRGYQDSHKPTKRVVYQEVTKKSRKGIAYINYQKLMRSI